MGAVANNPEFAAEVGVPQSVGASFMAKDKKKYMGGGLHRMPKYQRGDMVEADRTSAMLAQGLGSAGATPGLPTIGAPEGPPRRRPTARESRMDETRNRPMGFRGEELDVERGEEFDVKRVKPRKKKKKKGLRNLYAGGKVRGCGKAVRGRKKAKRIVMKGS